jgi:hypothetical protein
METSPLLPDFLRKRIAAKKAGLDPKKLTKEGYNIE